MVKSVSCEMDVMKVHMKVYKEVCKRTNVRATLGGFVTWMQSTDIKEDA